jgi:hypothetical protein
VRSVHSGGARVRPRPRQCISRTSWSRPNGNGCWRSPPTGSR